MQFVESQSEIAVSLTNTAASEDLCTAWDAWEATMPFAQDDSGI